MPWLARVAAVMQAWYPGQECGHAIADVLFGRSDPGGRLPQTFPRRLADNAATGNYPGSGGEVRYEEGVFIGYRHHEQHDLTPLFAFGHGLSYTQFAYGPLQLSSTTVDPGGTLEVTLQVTNIGRRSGQEVVQLYVADERASVDRPPKELKGFRKLHLDAGCSGTARFALDMRALAFFDESEDAWLAEAGRFSILVGASSQDIRCRAAFVLTRDWRQAV
jgi:beta-glucosidase